ncbi:MAG: hypothetical protein COX44_01585 [Candidatus Portnoybacteria bacterium CG23_combo_of_CG06-09_8_20_14_all_37_13]|uniref:EamA domain-containing protein n=1 Tax=Candidatus Portnoybacteria bacterium CG23_combo_of_CG06-09_8_20_14_all_37_13 TaxID=1974819 RepID=A0A2G9YD30_9BACT|nr:MAG: hypothetical protein COX44_01585 [Candidatus Portnoybacteria bacterium CG23_combo_of_CG06-09_8_20_14_all_37_13]
MNKSKIAYFYLGFVIILWASAPAVAKILLKNLNNFQVLFFTTLIATITLFLIALFQNKIKLICDYKLKDYLTFAYMGGLGIFLYYLFSFGSLMLISAQESTIVNYLWPIMVVIFASLILKEKLTLTKITAIILSFLGVYIVISQGNLLSFTFSNKTGVLLAFLGAVSYGLFSVLGKQHNYERITSMMFYYLFSFVFITIAVLIFSKIQLPNLYELIGLLWLGAIISGIAYVLWFLALKYGETSKVSNIIYLTPFVALIYISILVGEKILFSSIIGLIVIILGISLQFLKLNKNSKKIIYLRKKKKSL